MNNDLDHLKDNWKNLDLPSPEIPSHRDLKSSLRHGGALTDGLRRRFRSLMILSIGMMILIPILFSDPFSTWFILTIEGFFGLTAILDAILWNKLCGIDLGMMSMREALREVLSFKRSLQRFKIATRVLVVPALGLMVWQFYLFSGARMIWGALIGAVTGMIIGLAIDRRNRDDIRKLRTLLEELS